MKSTILVLTLCMFGVDVAAGAASAGTDIVPSDFRHLKTGLWEGTRISESSQTAKADLGSMDMSKFSAEERARVEAVLKRQQARAASEGPKSTKKTKRFCVKQEQLDRGERLMQERDGPGDQCTNKVNSRSSSRVAVVSECTQGAGHFTSELIYEFKSPEEWVGKVSVNGSYGGHPIKSSTAMSAHWIAADCGNVK